MEELRLRNAALAEDLMAQKAKRGISDSENIDPEAVAKAELRCSRLQLENDALKREVPLTNALLMVSSTMREIQCVEFQT